MDREQFRKAGYAAVDRICDYFESLESYDVVPRVQPGDVAKLIADEAPEEGEPWEQISQDFDRVILPGITHWQHPNFFAYFPANTTFECILADMYAGAVSNPGFNWLCSPACTELESKATDWVAKLIGLDQSWCNEGKVGGGVITGSASESCLTVCIAARERYLRLHPGTPASELVIVATTQTHSLAAKAALILGLEFVAIETKKEDDWALRGQGLREALEGLEAKGKKPFVLITTLGSTSTGAIDRIDEITAVTTDYPSLFLHVDAAWGGVFLALPECQQEAFLAAINARAPVRADEGAICAGGEVHSFCTNLHKSGLVTFDASCMWIRDRALLTTALDVTPPFLRTPQAQAGLVTDYRNMGLALGRRFRSLKVWFALRSFGVSGFRRHLRHLISLAETFESALFSPSTGVPGVVLFAPRRFSLVVFRVVSNSSTLSGLAYENALNAAVVELANLDPSLMVTPTTVGGESCVRIAIGSPFTREKHVLELVEKIRGLVDRAREQVDAAQQQ
ncbi:pyridoxal phosphate-dependent decarboxylase family protein [Rhodotorula paludigena]|uniref:pyridoxal phosphate-dependent decarboxylase family protein n=1 Tax=Rhodotorula paludigena TaxID=86838 RepID=UPI0031768B3A